MIMITPIKILPEILVVFKRRILYTLLLILVGLQVAFPQAQGSKQAIDSLERLLISAKPDTNRVIILNSLANYYMSSNPEKGKATASDALSLARDLNYYDGQIRSLANLSFGSSITGEWAKGLDLAFQGIQLAKQHKPELEPSFSSIIGLAYQKQKNYKKILEWTLKPLHSKSFITRGSVLTQDNSGILKDLIYPGFQIWSCSMVSSFGFMETGSIDSAFHYAIKSLEAARDSNLPEQMTGYSYGTLAYVYMKNKQFDSSRFYFQKEKQIM